MNAQQFDKYAESNGLYAAAREWLFEISCNQLYEGHPDYDYYKEKIDESSDEEIKALIEDNWDGGWIDFVRCGCWADREVS